MIYAIGEVSAGVMNIRTIWEAPGTRYIPTGIVQSGWQIQAIPNSFVEHYLSIPGVDNLLGAELVISGGVVTQIRDKTSNIESMADVLESATIYARSVATHMNTQWLVGADGQFLGDGDHRTRWANTWYWLLSPLLAIRSITTRNDSTWNVSVALRALDAYQSLVPNNPLNIETWYRAHSMLTWQGYRAELSGSNRNHARVFFRWTRTTTALPAFASDAAASTEWIGTSNRLSAVIPLNAASVNAALA